MTKNAENRIAVVTGAARSLGFAIATQLHEDGFHILMVDRDARIQQIAAELGRSGSPAQGFVVDLADATQIEAFIKSVEQDFGGCDVLVNNAGINLDKPDGSKFFVEEVTDEGWQLMMNVNLRAPFMLCRGLIPSMKRKGWGRIVNIASRAGRTYVAASNVHYSASKAGLIGMTRMLAGECASFGITANCIAPGRIDSDISARQSKEILEQSLKAIPAARIGAPTEIGATVSFLVSAGAAYTTGVTLDVNGGAFIG
ncbi:MAG: SDR family NAD(P)-dependent oxidoreductase [Janthinobacterium lividum]